MATLKELRDVRIDKLNKLREMGIDPFPAKSQKDHPNSEIVENYDAFEGKKVTLTGRIMSWREHGSLVFADLQDFTGRIQLYIHKDDLKKTNKKDQTLGFEDLNLLDIGDFVQVTGEITKSKKDEISIQPSELKLLTKSLRPLPEKHEGLKDPEVIFRRRYLDLVMNKDHMDLFKRKAVFWQANRRFMEDRGFIEVETPIMEHVTGGADATPFVTHHEALDQDFYLRISTELYLKRLVGGGFEKVYTLGPNFRNEGLSDEHLQEYYQIEWYWAYADYRDNMEMVKEMFRYIAKEVYGTTKFIRGEHEFDLDDEWEELDYIKIIKDKLGIDIFKDSEDKMLKVLQDNNVSISGDISKNRLIDNLWKVIRKDISGPTFLVNEPKFMSPLAKSKPENPELTERFHIVLAGSELGNGYSELNDPQDQFMRFKDQQEARDSGDSEAQMMDIDYVEMLEYGMPPVSGYAHSERLFWFLENVTAREGTLFPQMRYRLDEVTKEIYKMEDSIPETATVVVSDDISGLPSREEAMKLLEKHVGDEYQKLHAKMVALALEGYAEKFGEDKNLWYITGLLHDIDYFEFPEEHPGKSMDWFADWGYPEQLQHAVAAHAWMRTGIKPATKLAAALIATDELAGFLYAYSLMRPTGWDGMKPKSVKKKFKDKAFAAKIDREEILFGIEKLEEDFNDHVNFLISVFEGMSELNL